MYMYTLLENNTLYVIKTWLRSTLEEQRKNESKNCMSYVYIETQAGERTKPEMKTKALFLAF